jgi:phage gp46-like protein
MDAWLNPSTADYQLLSGAATRTPGDGLANAIYIRLMTPLGSWWQDATLGSRLHELVRQKDLKRVAILAKQYAETALQLILDDGRATEIQVSTEQPHNGRLHLLIAVTAASGEKLTFKHPVKVN